VERVHTESALETSIMQRFANKTEAVFFAPLSRGAKVTSEIVHVACTFRLCYDGDLAKL
jgi:hypothetical protein